MAYLIINNDGFLYKIAANDTDKNNQNCDFSIYTTIDISDDNFLKIKQELVDINISDGSATFTDRDFTTYSLTENHLKQQHENILIILKDFLNSNNSSNSFYDNCLSYKNYLETLDYSTITFPLTKTWGKYCEDNSITYLHPLQIP
jgi:hypothetical protein